MVRDEHFFTGEEVHIVLTKEPKHTGEDVLRKIYTKKMKEKSTERARSSSKMTRFINKQDGIL